MCDNKQTFHDNYDKSTLLIRYNNYKLSYLADKDMIHKGLNIRHQNPPEDITENIR